MKECDENKDSTDLGYTNSVVPCWRGPNVVRNDEYNNKGTAKATPRPFEETDWI